MSFHVSNENIVLTFDVTLDAFGLLHKATVTITLNGSETEALDHLRDFLVDHWEDWCNSHLRSEFLAFLAQGTGGVPL